MNDRDLLRHTAEYQFGSGAGAALFDPVESLDVRRTSSGRPRQIIRDGKRLATYRTDGRFTIGPAGAKRLQSAFESPRLRVIVGEESAPFVREGRNAFAKFVRTADSDIRPGDEVLVVDGSGSGGTVSGGTVANEELLGVGRAELSGEGMLEFETGMAVNVRHGVPAPTTED